MHELLIDIFGENDAKLPSLYREVKPFVLARDFGIMPRDRPGSTGKSSEFYRFQLGPRTWSLPIHIHDKYVPSKWLTDHEKDAEGLATRLKMAGWERLVQQLIAPMKQGATTNLTSPSADDELPDLHLALCWQADGRYLIIHDRSSATAIALTWDADNLQVLGEASTRHLGVSEQDTVEAVVIPYEEGLIEPMPSERAGQMDELSRTIHWRYGTKLDHKFDALLLEACDRMAAIDGNLGIAYSGLRYNDAGGDDNWLAVKYGNFAWENGGYFRSNAQTLRSAPTEVHTLLGLLIHLQTCELSSAFNSCYGKPVVWSDVIGLFRQDGQYYFACCNSEDLSGPVYSVDITTGRTYLCGFSSSYDWRFNIGSRAGGAVPSEKILEIVTIEEVLRRVKTGDTPWKAGPPHELAIPWKWYLPSEASA